MKALPYMRSIVPAFRRRMAMVLLAVGACVCRGGPVQDLPPPGQDGGGTPVQWEPPAAPLTPPPPPVASAAKPAPVAAPAPVVPKRIFEKESAVVTAEVVAAVEPMPVVRVVTQQSTVASAPVAAAKQEVERDPFWPVDYTPPVLIPVVVVTTGGASATPVRMVVPEVVIQESEWRAMEKDLTAAAKNWGRMREKPFVLIHGKSYIIGDTVSLATGGKTFRWRITDITRQAGPVFERLLPKPVGAGAQQ